MVLVRAADIECEIAVHPVMPAPHLVGQGLGAGRVRVGVGHLEHAGDATHHRAERAGFQVFLVHRAGFAEMHLGIDHARKDMQPAAIDRFSGSAGHIPDRHDLPATDGEIADTFAIVIDDGSALEDQIIRFCHAALGVIHGAPVAQGVKGRYSLHNAGEIRRAIPASGGLAMPTRRVQL